MVFLMMVGFMLVFHMIRVKVRRRYLLVVFRMVGLRVLDLAVVFITISLLFIMVGGMMIRFHMVVTVRNNIHRVVRRGKVCWWEVCRVQSSACRSEAVEAWTMNLAVESGSSVVSMVTQVSQGDGHQETQHLEYKDDMETSHWLSSTDC